MIISMRLHATKEEIDSVRARIEELRPVRRPRAADDFEAIRGRMEELRWERAQVSAEKRGPQRPAYLLPGASHR
jgi:chromosome segregation ATPase